jgi:hypothetical protein
MEEPLGQEEKLPGQLDKQKVELIDIQRRQVGHVKPGS